jgi:hypothetical protein
MKTNRMARAAWLALACSLLVILAPRQGGTTNDAKQQDTQQGYYIQAH